MKKDVLQVFTVGDEVYKRMKSMIITGELHPGKKITIREIANIFGVSTMPVRESLRKLQVEGLVKYERRSVTINKLSIKEVEEIYEIRKKIEKMAIEWALPNIKENDIEFLESILHEMDNNLNDIYEWQRLNKEFHLKFYSYSQSKPLNQILNQVWGSVEPYMYIYSSNNSNYSLQVAHLDHYRMLECIKNNQLEELIELTMKHMSNTCEEITQQIYKKGE